MIFNLCFTNERIRYIIDISKQWGEYMELREAIKQILKETGRTQIWLAKQLGYSSGSSIQRILARGNIELNTLLRICETIGAKIVVRYGCTEVELSKKGNK